MHSRHSGSIVVTTKFNPRARSSFRLSCLQFQALTSLLANTPFDMKSHTKGNFCDIRKETLEPLTDDLLHHWDDTYSAEKFPPSSKFQDLKIDKVKNRHILKCHIHSLPKIEQFINAFEKIVSGITVNSVWLLKKSKEDDDLASGHEVQDDRDHCC